MMKKEVDVLTLDDEEPIKEEVKLTYLGDLLLFYIATCKKKSTMDLWSREPSCDVDVLELV
ncbi:hypothetical protein F2Q70_00013609 [Brassica cretica]|uniref:Uncharacterized protein n=1 Tax=Brassica cretica TaxID=69181 RepID=A0A8S9M6J0_BRACR|nr:hypothetical protein F2Q70_00013609 [Brassica cretica]